MTDPRINYPSYMLGALKPVKRKVFVSYHHRGDQAYYDNFSKVFHDTYEALYDNSLERIIDSEDPEYVMRRIREKYITGTSCTIVLVGAASWGRKYIDWEIDASLQAKHGLIGVQLPTLPVVNNTVTVPDRLNDNIQSNFALWMKWDYVTQNLTNLPTLIEQANAKSKDLIVNNRARRLRNT